MEIYYDDAASRELSGNLSTEKGKQQWFGVTDLVNPARKYYEIVNPGISEDAEVIEKFRHGNNVHEMMFRWIRHFAPSAVREEEVNGEFVGIPGVRGRIDFRIEDHIIEFKTTSHDINDQMDVLSRNPQDLEQLVFYAVLSSRIEGEHYLVYYEEGHDDLFRAFTVKIRKGADARKFVEQRLESMVRSVGDSDPVPLGQCRYFQYGCKFNTNHICGCDALPTIDSTFLRNSVEIQRNYDLERKLEDGRSDSDFTGTGSFSLWDLLIPKRVYLERRGLLELDEFAESATPDDTMAIINNSLYNSGIYRERREIRINEWSLGYIPIISIKPIPEDPRSPFERLFPALVRVNGNEPEKLSVSRISPFYILRLAMICSLSGSDTGYLVIGFKNRQDLVKCYRVRFKELSVTREKILERIKEIEDSIVSGRTESLPDCPSFIQNSCGKACLCRLPVSSPPDN